MISPISRGKIPESVWSKCRDFAQRCYKANKAIYEARGVSKTKAQQDITYGKAAEYGAYYYLKQIGHQPDNLPDIKAFGGKKEYDPDLTYNNLPIHVKAHKKYTNTPLSWVFAINDYPDGIAFLCEIDIKQSEIFIYGITRCEDLSYGNTIHDKRSKKAVYFYDIVNLQRTGLPVLQSYNKGGYSE